ncbi:major facilitator superfamily domain-containing protein [Stachybotrys elegans]|uniref:Major facilitator superfamily domain-containing protein n=1 Tax=Stachybotrys elegans TaxID=80388 RepID=A0A8K0T6C5_9HYPO|nr:major facilitator superfamily domain-containing protein [Stachybotrys elegans]
MNYGVFQEYYSSNWSLDGSRSTTGIIGTTSNGIIYLSMPLLFALFTKRWARWRQHAAVFGVAITSLSFFLSSYSSHVWHLVATQGVVPAFGCALVYSPATLSLGEWYSSHNRAVAYGIVLACKNVVGSVCPFIFRLLLDHYGFRIALKAWAAIAVGTGLIGIYLTPAQPVVLSRSLHSSQGVPWHFLRHKTFHIYVVAIVLQSSGYGIPQTYLNTYAHEVTMLSQATATLLLTLFNVPGIFASTFFGYLSDKKRFSVPASTVTAISAASSALSAFMFWGLSTPGNMAILAVFSITFGFFAGGYSATWGGIINELEQEAADHNEAIDPGLVYGLLNGARGIGYVSGGLAGVPLLGAGKSLSQNGFGYETVYGPLIIFTGLSSAFGGWGALWKCKKLIRRVDMEMFPVGQSQR